MGPFRRNRHRLIALICVLPLLWYSTLLIRRPSTSSLHRSLFRGIEYDRTDGGVGRPTVVHRLAIDLRAESIRPFVTPGRSLLEVKARTTSQFLDEFKLQVATNASIFSPCYSNNPFDYYPRSGEPVNISGQVIADGVEYSPPEQGWATLCFAEDNRASIAEGACPGGTKWGVATTNRLITDGVVAEFASIGDKATEPHPRVGVGIDESGYRLLLIVVDGRQPFYSEGVTLAELASMLRGAGALNAAALDGGGSATMVVENSTERQGDGGSRLLNAPIHTHIPLRERPVGTHLGFYADALR